MWSLGATLEQKPNSQGSLRRLAKSATKLFTRSKSEGENGEDEGRKKSDDWNRIVWHIDVENLEQYGVPSPPKTRSVSDLPRFPSRGSFSNPPEPSEVAAELEPNGAIAQSPLPRSQRSERSLSCGSSRKSSQSDSEEGRGWLGPPNFQLSEGSNSSQRRNRRSRSRSATGEQSQVVEAFTVGAGVEYWSITNQQWTSGHIVSRDGALGDLISYRVSVGPHHQLMPVTLLDRLRLPLDVGEPVKYRTAEGSWVPGTVAHRCPLQVYRRRYRIQLEHEEVPVLIGAEHLRRRHDVGSSTWVYLGPQRGWLQGEVLSEREGPVPPVRGISESHADELPWHFVTLQLTNPDGAPEIMEVPSYMLRTKEPEGGLGGSREAPRAFSAEV